MDKKKPFKKRTNSIKLEVTRSKQKNHLYFQALAMKNKETEMKEVTPLAPAAINT